MAVFASRAARGRTNHQQDQLAQCVLLIHNTHWKNKRASLLAGVNLGISQHQAGPQRTVIAYSVLRVNIRNALVVALFRELPNASLIKNFALKMASTVAQVVQTQTVTVAQGSFYTH